jgi:ABC-type glycerol-3-phosphate transport system permease component
MSSAFSARIVRKSIGFALVFLICLAWLVPVLFLFNLSSKQPLDYTMSAYWALPQRFVLLENVRYVFERTQFLTPYLNSIGYAIAGSAIAIFFSSLAAFAVTKLRITGGFTIFLLLWTGMIFPIQIYLIPLYKAYLTINLYNTRVGLLLIYVAICTPFCVFVFRSFFLSLTDDYHEAARIEGCTSFQIYSRIFLPNSLGPIAVLFLFQGSFIWNDLILGMVLTGSQKVRPVMNALSMLNSIYSGTNVPAVMAGNLLACLPVIVLYLALQKYFIQGLKIQAAGE